jgi:hypothetical protein
MGFFVCGMMGRFGDVSKKKLKCHKNQQLIITTWVLDT